MSNKIIETPVPTNVITGFLGVGKTTAIQNLLALKPANERWAVLVNEFGEIGIDGALFNNNAETTLAHGDAPKQVDPNDDRQRQGIFVREVPGGCMCCASGIPMQVALNLLLAEAKPDRLLIEPTGLGHPFEVLDVLTSEHYGEVLSLHATLTLVDARKVTDERYRSHDTFRQQLRIADHIIASKSDLYSGNEVAELQDLLAMLGKSNVPVSVVEHGKLQPDWLAQGADKSIAHLRNEAQDSQTQNSETPQNSDIQKSEPHNDTASSPNLTSNAAVRKPMLITKSNVSAGSAINLPMSPTGAAANSTSGQFLGFFNLPKTTEGFVSDGKVYSQQQRFSYDRLFALLSGVVTERLKAVFITDKGTFAFNLADGALQVSELTEALDSRIEWICHKNDVMSDLHDGLQKAQL